MTDINLIEAVAQVGFPIATAVFLLWKGYTQDKEYMAILIELKSEIIEIRKEVMK